MRTKTRIFAHHSWPWTNLVLILLLSVISEARAQKPELAPVGAEWYYGYQEIVATGYIKITAVGDTIIDGLPCVKLEKTRTGYGYWSAIDKIKTASKN